MKKFEVFREIEVIRKVSVKKKTSSFHSSREGLLDPHRAPPQVTDRGTLTGTPEGTGKIKYPGRIKTSTKSNGQNARKQYPRWQPSCTGKSTL